MSMHLPLFRHPPERAATGPGDRRRRTRAAHHPASRRSRALWRLSTFVVIASGLAGQVIVNVPAVAAATNTLNLNVQSARTEPRAFGGAGVIAGAAVATYKFIINVDNTGTTAQRTPADGCSPASAGYPGSCKWSSIAGLPGSAPIVTQGDQSILNGSVGIDLPDGRYLITVLADGFKMDGAPFSVPLAGPLTVELQPTPLPAATVSAQIFADTTEANGQFDPGEVGLPGFRGELTDYLGLVTTDVYGNPLCTQYETDGSGQVILTAPDYSRHAGPRNGRRVPE